VRCALGLIALCIGIRWFEFAQGLFAESLLQFRTENRFDGLLWGCLMAVAMRRPAICAWLKEHLTLRVFFAMIAILVVLLVVFSSPPGRRTLVAAFMPVLIGYTVLHADELVGHILKFPVLKWIGRLPYRRRPRRARPSHWLMPLCLAALVVITLAALSWPVWVIARRRHGVVLSLGGHDLKAYRLVCLFSLGVLAALPGWMSLLTQLRHAPLNGHRGVTVLE
jgi:hypothetical protein